MSKIMYTPTVLTAVLLFEGSKLHRRVSIMYSCFLVIYEPRCEKTGLRGFPIRSDTNRATQAQKMARGLKFRI